MKPTVHVLGIHLPEQKIVLTSGPGDALEKIDIPSPFEKIFRSHDRQFIWPIDFHRLSLSVFCRCPSSLLWCWQRFLRTCPLRQSKKEFCSLYPAFNSPTDAWTLWPKTASSTVYCQKVGGPPISQLWTASDFPWGWSPTWIGID
jgi:hypothetical protein